MKLLIKAAFLMILGTSMSAFAASHIGYIGKVTDIYVMDGFYGTRIAKFDDFAAPSNNCPAD